MHPSRSHLRMICGFGWHTRRDAACMMLIFATGWTLMACRSHATTHRSSASVAIEPKLSPQAATAQCRSTCLRALGCGEPSHADKPTVLPAGAGDHCTAACVAQDHAQALAQRCEPLDECPAFRSCALEIGLVLSGEQSTLEDIGESCERLCGHVAQCAVAPCDHPPCKGEEGNKIAEPVTADPACVSECRSALGSSVAAKRQTWAACLPLQACEEVSACVSKEQALPTTAAQTTTWVEQNFLPVCLNFCNRVVTCSAQDQKLDPQENQHLRESVQSGLLDCHTRCSLDVQANTPAPYDRCLREEKCEAFFTCAEAI